VSRFQTVLGLGTGLVLCSCGRSDKPAVVADLPTPLVEIVSPANGDSVSLPLTVRLKAIGVEVVPASGTVEPGKGHHHLVIDVPVPDPASAPLPSAPGVVHLGSGVQEYTIDSLAPGPHRIIAVFAAGNHVPMAGVRPDTVSFVVR